MEQWRRPKVLPSRTEHIESSCGTIHITFGFEDERLIEVRASIGKNGTCPNVQLDTICKLISMYLQSPEPRYKIVKKFTKQFTSMTCGNPFSWEEKEYTGCHDVIIKKIVKELEKQMG